MKKFCFALILTVIFLGNSQVAFSCTIYIPSFRKIYRESESVFVGKVLRIEDYYNPSRTEERQIPESFRESNEKLKKSDPQSKSLFSKITFEVKNRWKGNLAKQKAFVAVAFQDCGCPGDGFDTFELEQEYLVTASKKNFITVCNSKKADSDWAKDDIKKLNKFWFRTWATIYPF